MAWQAQVPHALAVPILRTPVAGKSFAHAGCTTGRWLAPVHGLHRLQSGRPDRGDGCLHRGSDAAEGWWPMTSKQQKRIEREEGIIRMFGHTLPLNKFRGG